MKFSEMPYKRIDMEEVEKEYKSIIERTKNAKSGEEQFEIHREYYKFTADVQTSMELAMIRHASLLNSRSGLVWNFFMSDRL